MYSKDLKTLIQVPCGKRGDFCTIKETEVIRFRAFYESSLSCVKIEASVKEICSMAFSSEIYHHNDIREIHIRHEHPEKMKISDDAFDKLGNCKLYVPIGTGYAYRHHPAFKDKFVEVIIEK